MYVNYLPIFFKVINFLLKLFERARRFRFTQFHGDQFVL